MDGEDSIVKAMQRFANDAKCVEYLSEFKGETEDKIGAYKKAFVLQQKSELSERALKQLQSIASFEASMGSALQDLLVKEAASSFKETFPSDPSMQSAAFNAAVKGLAGTPLTASDDPVAKHFDDAFASLAGVDLMSSKGDPSGTLAERIAYAQQSKEAEFKSTFMVTPGEVSEVKAAVASGDDAALEKLYTAINAKVGYALPETLGTKPIPTGSDSGANAYIESVNAQLATIEASLKQARLKAFASAFA